MKVNWKRLVAACFTSLLWGSQAWAACPSTEVEPNNSDTMANIGLYSDVYISGSVNSVRLDYAA